MKKARQVRSELSPAQEDAIGRLLEAFAPGEGHFLPPEFPRALVQRPLSRVPSSAELKAARASMYYWWWRFLKESKEYPPKGEARKSGPIAELYRDFGSLGTNFDRWWTRTGRKIFSEPRGTSVEVLYDSAWDSGDDDTAEILIVTVFKNVARRKIEQDFALKLNDHHVGPNLVESTHKRSRRQLYLRKRLQDKAFPNMLEAWKLGSKKEQSWTEIGRKLNRNPGKKGRVNKIAVARELPQHQNKRARDYYKRAERLLHHAARGDFPRED